MDLCLVQSNTNERCRWPTTDRTPQRRAPRLPSAGPKLCNPPPERRSWLMLMMVIRHALWEKLGVLQRRLYFWMVCLIRCLWTLVSLFLFMCRCYTFVLEAGHFLLLNERMWPDPLRYTKTGRKEAETAAKSKLGSKTGLKGLLELQSSQRDRLSIFYFQT